MSVDFVHLHNHSDFSLLDSTIKVPALVERTKELGMKAISLTDHGNVFGHIKLYNECKKNGIKPIIGMEAYVSKGAMATKKRIKGEKEYYHLVLLCQNDIGYQNLLKIVSTSYKEGFYYKPRIDKEFLSSHSEGLIASSACLGGELAQAIMHDDLAWAEQTVGEYTEIFPNSFFLEVQDHKIKEQLKVNREVFKLADRLEVPVIATNDIHFLTKEDYEAHKVLKAINFNQRVDSMKHVYTHGHYLRSPQEMWALFGERPDCLLNTVEIAERCDVSVDQDTYHFPKFDVPEGHTVDSFFQEQAWKGLEEKLVSIEEDKHQEYKDRLDFELKTIKKMGFQEYFLVVSDFSKWALANDIPVGPGRGSAAGSVAVWSLDITKIDPVKHGLLFARFLNPDRMGPPDFGLSKKLRSSFKDAILPHMDVDALYREIQNAQNK